MVLQALVKTQVPIWHANPICDPQIISAELRLEPRLALGMVGEIRGRQAGYIPALLAERGNAGSLVPPQP